MASPKKNGHFEWRVVAVDEAGNGTEVVERSKRQWGNPEDVRKDLVRDLASRGLDV